MNELFEGNREQYYAQMSALAREKRAEFEVNTKTLNTRFVLGIYKKCGISVDRRNLSYKIRGAYFCDEDVCSVLLNRNLPKEPKLFTLVHELKHHFVDRNLVESGQLECGDYNTNEVIEIGAEVFAAEFIFPSSEMTGLLEELGISKASCQPSAVVEIKRNSPVSVSYSFITKRLEGLNVIGRGQFLGVKFTKLEEQLYGVPIYKQDWFKASRRK